MEIVKNDVRKELENAHENILLLSYRIIHGHFPSFSKKQLIQKLYQFFPYDLIWKHKEYSSTITPSQYNSFEFYQGIGYNKINLYLRYKKISKSWLSDENMDSIEISPRAFSKKGFQQIFKQTKHRQLSLLKKNLKKTINANKYDFKKIKTAISDILYVIYHAPKLHVTFYAYRGEENYSNVYKLTSEADSIEMKKEEYKLSQLNLHENSTYLAKGFNSFSIAPWVTLNFAGQCCIYRIKIDDSVPYIIFPHSDRYKEYEVLLPPCKFKVTKIDDIVSPLSDFIRMRMYDIEFVKEIK